MNGDHALVVASLIAGFTSILVALLSSRRQLHAKVDEIASIASQHVEFWDDFHHRGWNNLPEGSATAVQLAVTLEQIKDRLEAIETRLEL